MGDSQCKDKQASHGDKERVAQEASVARSLDFSDDGAYIDTIKGDSDDKFWSSFPRDRNSRNFILGGPQKPDTMGMTAAEAEAAKKQYRKARKSFTSKERLALMKCQYQIKALPHCLRKVSWGFLKVILTRWFDQWSTWKVIIYSLLEPTFHVSICRQRAVGADLNSLTTMDGHDCTLLKELHW